MLTGDALFPAALLIVLVVIVVAALLLGRLVVTSERHRAERVRLLEQAQRRAEAEAVWSTVGKTLVETRELSEVLTSVIQIVNAKLKVETGSILLRESGSDELYFAKILRGSEEQFQSIRIALGQGVAGWVAATGQAALVPDVSKDPRFYSDVDRQTGFSTRSILCVPLISNGETIGVVELLNKQDGPFTPEDLHLLELIAAPIAISIQNARLGEQVKQHLRQVTDLLDKVERAKREWEHTIDALDAGISLVDADCRILRVNRTLANWLHTPPAELVGQYCYRAVYGQNDKLAYCPNAQSRVKGQSVEWEMEEPRLGGIFHFSTFPLRDPGGKPIGAVNLISDITKEKLLQAEMIQNQKLAATGRLAASLAHEINNPLQAIQACLELAKDNLGDAEKQRRYLSLATGELDRLANIVQHIMEFNRPGKGVRALVGTREILDDVLTLTSERIQHAGVMVETDWEDGLPPTRVVADQLRQVFLNLILNAIEAMPHGGRLKVRARVLEDNGRWVTIAFGDSGTGIAPDVLDKIFEPFYTGRAEGTGLGLSVCHQIITNHGGRITVESTLGLGSTFTVWLPV